SSREILPMRRGLIDRTTALSILGLVLLSSFILAATPVPSVQSRTPSPAPATPTAVTTSTPEVIPPTPGPPSPTPALPEQGGPQGGVLSGHLYVDSDQNGKYSAGDSPVGGTVIIDSLDGAGNVLPTGYSAATDESGRWELRALPDGTYRVRWDPPVPQEQWSRTIPPVVAIALNPNETIHAVAQTVQIHGASRVLNIDF